MTWRRVVLAVLLASGIAFCLRFVDAHRVGLHETRLRSGGKFASPAYIPSRYASIRDSFESADPAQDAFSALENGDKRFLAVKGYGRVVPGVPDFYEKHFLLHDVRLIPHTTAEPLSREHGRLQDAAWRYAERYNHVILSRMSEN